MQHCTPAPGVVAEIERGTHRLAVEHATSELSDPPPSWDFPTKRHLRRYFLTKHGNSLPNPRWTKLTDNLTVWLAILTSIIISSSIMQKNLSQCYWMPQYFTLLGFGMSRGLGQLSSAVVKLLTTGYTLVHFGPRKLYQINISSWVKTAHVFVL